MCPYPFGGQEGLLKLIGYEGGTEGGREGRKEGWRLLFVCCFCLCVF